MFSVYDAAGGGAAGGSADECPYDAHLEDDEGNNDNENDDNIMMKEEEDDEMEEEEVGEGEREKVSESSEPIFTDTKPHRPGRHHKESKSDDEKATFHSRIRARFEDALKFDDELERKIEDTIESIQDEGASAREKVAHSFSEAHERLKAEEAKVMEELENACNEAEEMLQNALLSIRDVHEHSIAFSEASSAEQGQDETAANMRMDYEMEKQLHTMEELQKMTLTRLDIEWDDNGRKLSFTKRLINGVPVPDSISFSDVHSKCVNISWNCDSDDDDDDNNGNDENDGIINNGIEEEGDDDDDDDDDDNREVEDEEENEDGNDTRYCVEMRKSDDRDEWKEVYSGRDKWCNVNGLCVGTEYDVRVKCVVGELMGGWSSVVNVRTRDRIKINSMILLQEKNKDYFVEKVWSDSG